MKKPIIFLLVLVLFSGAVLFFNNYKKTETKNANAQTGAAENLGEMISRISRASSATFPLSQIENASNNYTWQPETLTYKDVTTGHEVWILVHKPNNQDIYSKENGTNAWSFDGSRIGFYDFGTRKTNNPSIRTDRGAMRWLVKTDGSSLRAAEGYGKYTTPSLDGFSWSYTENAYYSFGSDDRPIMMDGPTYNLYKMNPDNSNVVSGTLVLNTSGVNSFQKEMVKDGISFDGSRIVARDLTSQILATPNPISTTQLYFIDLKPSPVLTYHWGIARHVGPSTNNWSDPYGDIDSVDENHFHDAAAILGGKSVVGTYSGSGVFVEFKDHGSYSDGGPLWQDWNGTSFGNNELRVISDGAGTPDNPWGLPYFGHPVWDRWSRYALFANYNDPGTCAYGDNCKPGMMIYDRVNNTALSNYPFQYNSWTSNHQSWTGWTDWVLAVNAGTYFIESNKWDATTKPGGINYQAPMQVANTHYVGPNGNYNAYPRPSQSPDGTKVAFAQYFLNGGQGSPYIAWAVVYYPYPPTNLSASYSSGVRLSWLPPKYTTRGWPNESTDPAPYAREVKKYHVWRSASQSSGWQEIGSINATYHNDPVKGSVHDTANLVLTDNPGNGTFYYAVTTEEQSRLESDELSEILRVTVSGSSVTTQVVQAKGQKNFWRTAPAQPFAFSFTAQAAAGQYKLNWTEPNDLKVRYYNIYYSNSTNPTAIQQQRIASVPVGTATYLDWLADASAAGHYGITSVDRYGNESAIVLSGAPSDTTPPQAPSGVTVN